MNHATIQDSVDYLASIAYDDDGYLSRELWRDICDNQGSFRAVWLYDDVAFKFQLRPHLTDNCWEFDLYHKVSDGLRVLMAESYAISECGRVLAMEPMIETMLSRYAKNIDPDDPDDLSLRELDDVRALFNAHLSDELVKSGFTVEMSARLVMDNHARNVAYNKAGELRWIDYGFVAPTL